MLKPLGILFSITLLITIAVSYTFRLPITQWLLEPTLKSAKVELSCIDWSITPNLTLTAEKVCIHYQGHKLDLIGIKLTQKHLAIDDAILHISHLVDQDNLSESEKKAEPLQLSLPDTRPLISIKTLTVNTEAIASPITLTVTENIVNQFSITGDMNAVIDLAENNINADIHLTSNPFMQTALDKLLFQHTANIKNLEFDTHHQVQYNGENIELLSNIAVQFGYHQQSPLKSALNSNNLCHGEVSSKGKVTTRIQLDKDVIQLDANNLLTQVSLSDECVTLIPHFQYRDLLLDQLALNWQLTLPKTIDLRQNSLTLPSAHIESLDKNRFVLKLDNASINLNHPFKSAKAHLTADIKTKDIQSFQFDSHIKEQSISGNYAINLDKAPKRLDKKTDELNINAGAIAINGQFQLFDFINTPFSGKLDNQIMINNGAIETFSFEQYSGSLGINIDDQLNANAQLKNTLIKSLINDTKISDLQNTTDIRLNLAQITPSTTHSQKNQFPPIHIEAVTRLSNIQHPVLALTNLDIETDAEAIAGNEPKFSATHRIQLKDIKAVANHTFTSTTQSKNHPFRVTIPNFEAALLNPFIQQFDSAAQVTNGNLGVVIEGDLNTQSAKIRAHVEQLSALYNDYLLTGFSTYFTGNMHSALSSDSPKSKTENTTQVTIHPTHFTLNELRTGVVLQNIEGQWQINQNQLSLNDIQGQLFDGYFSLDKYLFNAPKQGVSIRFDNIDASKLITLYDESGILLTGRYGGILPVVLEGEKIDIQNGTLLNQNQGKLIIQNNAAFNAIKNQQKELQEVLSLLEDLDISQLRSSVKLDSKGELTLGMKLKGYNKKQSQEVNFNYNHEENVFTLLRALRLSDEITQRVEQEFLK